MASGSSPSCPRHLEIQPAIFNRPAYSSSLHPSLFFWRTEKTTCFCHVRSRYTSCITRQGPRFSIRFPSRLSIPDGRRMLSRESFTLWNHILGFVNNGRNSMPHKICGYLSVDGLSLLFYYPDLTPILLPCHDTACNILGGFLGV